MLSLIDQRMLLNLISGELYVWHHVGTHELPRLTRLVTVLLSEILDVHWLRVRLRLIIFSVSHAVNILEGLSCYRCSSSVLLFSDLIG